MRVLARRAFGVVGWACLMGALTGAAPPPSPRGALDTLLEGVHRAGGFDGVVLVGRDTERVYERAFGLADRERRRPHVPEERFRWASVTKQLTALLVLQEVERGRLSLDAPLSQYLPTFSGPSASQVTPRQLLQHTSGLPNPNDTATGTDGVPDFYKDVRPGAVGNQAATAGVCAGPPKRSPGEAFEYNNCDYLVLGALLETLTGKPYARLVEERIAHPLGLRSLGHVPPDPLRAPRMPRGYQAAGTPEVPQNVATYGAGGALHGSARDLWRIDRALMGYELLSKELSERMWAGEPKLGYEALGVWSYPASLPGCAAAVNVIERQGQIGGVKVLNLLVPEQRVAVIFLSNTERTEYGAIWEGKGLAHDVLRTVLCATEPTR